MGLSPGQSLSVYSILGSLGVGGMGEVYRARDTRLDREVAIKVLPDDWSNNDTHVGRFEREAKTLASLNHPNVAQVYNFDEVDGTHFLVLELVEGRDLSELIKPGGLPLEEATDLCRQIAQGLEAAHELGVIHRDLKPANVRVTPEGLAKVLDFGLAKTVRRRLDAAEDGAREATFQTEAGLLVGTPTYMSPEHIRGRRVDRRADIWAFGCVVYECLIGDAPFDGDSLPDTLAAIASREPDLSRLPDDTPAAVRRLISRCLDKDPRTRLRDIGEARIILSGDSREEPTLPAPALPAEARRTGPGAATLLIAAAALVAVVLLARDAFSPSAPPSPLESATITKVTDSKWTEFGATISRDGDFVAFASDRDGPFDIWVHHVGAWDDRNLTQGRKPWWGLRIRDLDFHPDGTRIVSVGAGPDQLKSITVMSREEKDVFRPNTHEPSWSPNGSRVVFHSGEDGDPLYVAGPDGSNQAEILTHDSGLHQHYPIWSLDGEWIYVVRGRPATLQMDLWRVRPEKDGAREQLTTDQIDVSFPTPIDDDTVLFLGHEPNGAGPWLWSLDVGSGRPPRRVLRGAEQYTSLGASKDGRRIVATVANRRPSLWRVPMKTDGPARESDIELVRGLETVPGLGPRFAGDSLYFVSSRGTGDGLWCRRDGKAFEVLAGDETAVLAPPAVSPDGKSLAVVLRSKGRVRLWVVGADGQQPEAISDETQVYGSPAWSPDGKQIAVGGVDRDGPGLFLYPRGGGTPERLVDDFASNPVWSPTGDLIVYLGKSLRAVNQLRGVCPSDGSEFELPEIKVIVAGERHRFLPDGSGLVYMTGLALGHDFWLLNLETRQQQQLTQLDAPSEMRSFDIDPSGEFIVFDRIEQNSDVVLIDLKSPDDR